jgi:N-acetyl-beta-hexosaminidase
MCHDYLLDMLTPTYQSNFNVIQQITNMAKLKEAFHIQIMKKTNDQMKTGFPKPIFQPKRIPQNVLDLYSVNKDTFNLQSMDLTQLKNKVEKTLKKMLSILIIFLQLLCN